MHSFTHNDFQLKALQRRRTIAAKYPRLMSILVMLCLPITSCTSKLAVTSVAGGKGAGKTCSAGSLKSSTSSAISSSSAATCEAASNLTWSAKSPQSGLTADAQWTPSTSSPFVDQSIQFYEGDACQLTLQDITKLDSLQTRVKTLTAAKAGTFTYKIINADSKGNKVTSECSSAMILSGTSTSTKSSSASAGSSSSASSDTTAPVISQIPSQSTTINTDSVPIGFVVTESSTFACSSTYLSLDSSNTTVVATNAVAWSGTYPLCFATVSPQPGASGSTQLTITATDSSLNSSTATFSFTVSKSFAIGQPGIYRNAAMESNVIGPNNSFNTVTKIGNKFASVDSTGNRVLIWNSEPVSGQPADVILGQTNSYSRLANSNGSATPNNFGLYLPSRVFSDGTRLFVADVFNNRVLIWNSFPTTTGAPADVVVGQTNMTSRVAGSSPMASTLWLPLAGAVANNKLLILDAACHRVLIFNSIPTSNAASADLVLGQANFTSRVTATTATSLSSPYDVSSNGTKIIVTDQGNSRVLIWNSFPASNGQAADVVVGQANFTSSTGGITSSTFSSPASAVTDGTRLYVADGYRVLVWNTIPTSNGAAADFVLGQANMTSQFAYHNNIPSFNALATLNYITATTSKLYVPDSDNSRVLVWNLPVTSDFQAADSVIGQPNGTTNLANNHGLSIPIISYTNSVASDGTRLLVSSWENRRSLIWNSIPTSAIVSPNLILGQANMNQVLFDLGGSVVATNQRGSFSTMVGTKYLVADTTNNRVLIWNALPTTNNQTPDLVLGQANFTSNGTGCTSNTMSGPKHISTDGTKLFVSDTANSRVLVWSTFPTTNGQAASYAIGQANLTSCTGATTAGGLNAPNSAQVIGSKLYVADTNNSRVQIWNSIPGGSGVVANLTIGQPNQTSSTSNNGGISAATMNLPTGIVAAGTKILVSDTYNHRILVWNSAPTATGQAADAVIGQPDFVSSTINNGGLSDNAFYSPGTMAYVGTKLFIADWNMRILVKEYP